MIKTHFAMFARNFFLRRTAFASTSLQNHSSASEAKMVTIEKGNKVLTLINVFSVEPEKQDQLVALLSVATDQTMQHLPGFISASIHRSIDGKKVVNYAQWESMAAFEAMRKNPEAAA